MENNYKIAMIGLGSIGSRHVMNIVTMLKTNNTQYKIDLIRSGRSKELNEEIAHYISNIYYTEDLIPDDYDIVFITNPTNLHYNTIKQFSEKSKYMFIEKPIFNSIDYSLDSLCLKKDDNYYVACPLRYTKVIQYIKNHLDLTEVISVRAICSSYLPEWRKTQDYRKTYSAHKDQGGGVSIDLIHEWDYLCYLFGKPIQLYNIRGRYSRLEINSDDVSLYLAKYTDKVIEVHLDYFGREAIREIQLITNNDTIVGDLIKSEIRFLNRGEVIPLKEDRNDFYYKEIEHFFNIIEGKAVNDNNIQKAFETLKITEGVLD